MILRPAVPSDRAMILAAAERLAKVLYPKLEVDFPKMAAGISEAVSSANNFCWIAEKDGALGAVLLAMVAQNNWAKKRFCSVLLWVSDIPGAGVKLLRKFREWIRGRKGVKVAGFAPDTDTDPRIWQLVERVGFKKCGGAYLLYN